jgi:hypothetical protein
MTTIICDIETGADERLIDLYLENIKPHAGLKDPDKIKADLEKKQEEAYAEMFIDRDCSSIKMIGVVLDGVYKRFSTKEFVEWLDTIDFPRFVTFRGTKFDFPIIVRNIIKDRIEVSNKVALELKEASSRYPRNHIDMSDKLVEYGKRGSLDFLSQVYLGAKKSPINFLTCTDAELEEHNKQDCLLLEQLYGKFKDYI